MSDHYTLDPGVQRDFNRLFLGDRLGGGCFREVYSHALDDGLVIKIAKDEVRSNVMEHQVWNEVEHTRWAKWFAPVEWISDMGSVLIQRRVKPASPNDVPKKLPSFFTDLKLENFGIYKGRFVACDYGNNLFISNALSNVRLRLSPKPSRW